MKPGVRDVCKIALRYLTTTGGAFKGFIPDFFVCDDVE